MRTLRYASCLLFTVVQVQHQGMDRGSGLVGEHDSHRGGEASRLIGRFIATTVGFSCQGLFEVLSFRSNLLSIRVRFVSLS